MSFLSPAICLAILNTVLCPSLVSNLSANCSLSFCWALATAFLAALFASIYSLSLDFSSGLPLTLCHSLSFVFFMSIIAATSSFHHHVCRCLAGPFVHPHTSSVAFNMPFRVDSHSWLMFHSSFSSISKTSNLFLTSGFLSFQTFLLGWNFSFCDDFLLLTSRSQTIRR